MKPFLGSVIVVNRPLTGADSVTVAGARPGGAWARFGRRSARPVPGGRAGRRAGGERGQPDFFQPDPVTFKAVSKDLGAWGW